MPAEVGSGSRVPAWSARRRWLAASGLVAAAVLGMAVWALWPSSGPAPRARTYLAFTACLLTDDRGVAGAAGEPVWAGMQDASLATGVKVQYLPAVGATGAGEVSPYLASLVQRHCDLVVAVGAGPVAAVASDARSYPHTRFVAVGKAPSASNVVVVDEPSAARVRERVRAVMRAGVGR
jgi:basic membrane lipoprotein Med (substrate-binding protein (PBP1-ABC) superfamily)